MKLQSSVFQDGQLLPTLYTCKGENFNPPLQWSEVPRGTKSFTLIIEDIDAQPKPWVHWLVFNIPGELTVFPENGTPVGVIEGICNGGTHGYEGPCPKYFSGVHHYVFCLFALDTILDLSHTADKDAVLSAQQGHELAVAKLTATAHGEKPV